MVKHLSEDKKLAHYCTYQIEDAGVSIGVDESLTQDRYIGIKLDDFYAGLELGNEQPKAVDFVVTVDCRGDWYNLYVLELKGGKNKNYSTEDIYEKYDTAVNDFLKVRYESVFCDDRYKYRNVYLYLVATTPFAALKYHSYEEYLRIRNRINARDTLSLDAEFPKVFLISCMLLHKKPSILAGKLIWTVF